MLGLQVWTTLNTTTFAPRRRSRDSNRRGRVGDEIQNEEEQKTYEILESLGAARRVSRHFAKGFNEFLGQVKGASGKS